jgi:hypothetical protein
MELPQIACIMYAEMAPNLFHYAVLEVHSHLQFSYRDEMHSSDPYRMGRIGGRI